MTLLTIGGDMRYAYMSSMAAARSMDIGCIGLDQCGIPLPSATLEDIPRARAVILSNPWRSGLSLPYSSEQITTDAVLSRLRGDALLVLPDTVGMPSSIKTDRVIDLSHDSEYTLKNAHLTAEGAIHSAMNRSDRALSDSRCLVIGYGRIGKRLAFLLSALGAQVTIAARRKESREEAHEHALNAIPMEDLSSVLPHVHFIFSTPPSIILDRQLLSLIRKDALLMDLASPPYGFDLNQAHSLSVNAIRENGLPGRYCPLSAGSVLLAAVLRALDACLKGESTCDRPIVTSAS